MAGSATEPLSSPPLSERSWQRFERLAEVVCPPSSGGPSAGPETLAKLDSYLRALPVGVRRAFRGALFAFDQGARLYPPARGRAFVQLPGEEAERYLRFLLDERLGGSVSQAAAALRSTVALCHFDVREVRESVGYDPDPHILDVATRRLQRHGAEIERAEAATVGGTGGANRAVAQAGLISDANGSGDLELDADVAVVGSGAGGATMAAELAEAGIDVVIIEEGGYHATESFGTEVVGALGDLYRSGGTQTIVGRTPISFLEGRCVGGSTVVNGGMCWRTPPAVLSRWSQEDRITAIGPEEMERHFEKAERRLSVAPQALDSMGGDSELLIKGAETLGWELSRSMRNQLHCGGCNNCLCGCPTGAKRSMLVTHVRRAFAFGARLVSGCRVDRIERRDGSVTGVAGSFVATDGSRGARVRVRAPVVVAACGAVQTPALLARSGLRRRRRMLGRNLTIHPGAALLAIFDEDVRGWEGVHQANQVTEFLQEGLLVSASSLPPALVALNLPHTGEALREQMSEYNRMVVAGCLVEDSGVGRVRMAPGVGPIPHYELNARDAEGVVQGLERAAELMAAAGARRFLLPVAGAPPSLDADGVLSFLRGSIRPRALRPFTVHAMGTGRMSEVEGRGVVSSFGEVHGAPGVFVCDASLLPGPVGVNPMETIVALGLRNAEQLISDRGRFGI